MNRQRNANGLPSLKTNTLLTASASAKCADMVARDYWAHNTPDGKLPWTFITKTGYRFKTAGENLATRYDTSQEVVNAWMNSTEHRDNILKKNYADVGTAVCQSQDYTHEGFAYVVVEHYGSPR